MTLRWFSDRVWSGHGEVVADADCDGPSPRSAMQDPLRALPQRLQLDFIMATELEERMGLRGRIGQRDNPAKDREKGGWRS